MEESRGRKAIPLAPAPPSSAQSDRLRRRVRILENMKRVRRKILVCSGKGGVGKSTVAVNVAAAMAARGMRVAVLDLDLTGPNVPKMLGIERAPVEQDADGMRPVLVASDPEGSGRLVALSMGLVVSDPDQALVWRGPIKMAAISQLLGDVNWGEQDLLVVDLPPGTGDEPLSVAQDIPEVDGAVIVATPQDVALQDVRRSVAFIRRLELPVLGLVENMAGLECPHCHKEIEPFKKGGGERMAHELGIDFLGRIPLDPAVMHGSDDGVPVALDGRARGPGRQAVDAIVARLSERLGISAASQAKT